MALFCSRSQEENGATPSLTLVEFNVATGHHSALVYSAPHPFDQFTAFQTIKKATQKQIN
jgi:hypothetical protein